MSWASVSNLRTGRTLHNFARVCFSDEDRAWGLLRSRADESVLIPGCKQIHTVGMRFFIDVLFLDDHGTVLECLTVSPGKQAMCPGADCVLEVPEGTIEASQTEVGDRLELAYF